MPSQVTDTSMRSTSALHYHVRISGFFSRKTSNGIEYVLVRVQSDENQWRAPIPLVRIVAAQLCSASPRLTDSLTRAGAAL